MGIYLLRSSKFNGSNKLSVVHTFFCGRTSLRARREILSSYHVSLRIMGHPSTSTGCANFGIPFRLRFSRIDGRVSRDRRVGRGKCDISKCSVHFLYTHKPQADGDNGDDSAPPQSNPLAFVHWYILSIPPHRATSSFHPAPDFSVDSFPDSPIVSTVLNHLLPLATWPPHATHSLDYDNVATIRFRVSSVIFGSSGVSKINRLRDSMLSTRKTPVLPR